MVRLCEGSDDVSMTKKQSEVVNVLKDVGSVSVKELCYFTGYTPSVISALEKKGVVECFEREELRSFVSRYAVQSAYDSGEIHLTDEQQKAYDGLLVSFQSFFHFNDVLDFGEEPQVNLGDIVNLFQSNTAADSLSNNEAALVVNAFDAVMNFFITQSLQLRHFQMVEADFQAANCFQHGSFKAALNCHNLTGSFHLSSQGAVSGYKFIERPTAVTPFPVSLAES